jgi:hypothetical protein
MRSTNGAEETPPALAGGVDLSATTNDLPKFRDAQEAAFVMFDNGAFRPRNRPPCRHKF